METSPSSRDKEATLEDSCCKEFSVVNDDNSNDEVSDDCVDANVDDLVTDDDSSDNDGGDWNERLREKDFMYCANRHLLE